MNSLVEKKRSQQEKNLREENHHADHEKMNH